MKQLFTGLLLAATLTSWGQYLKMTPRVDPYTHVKVPNKDLLYIHLQEEIRRLKAHQKTLEADMKGMHDVIRATIKWNIELQFQVDSLRKNAITITLDTVGAPFKGFQPMGPATGIWYTPYNWWQDNDTLFTYGRNKGGITPYLPGGTLGIPELDSVRADELIDSLGRLGVDTGTLGCPVDTSKGSGEITPAKLSDYTQGLKLSDSLVTGWVVQRDGIFQMMNRDPFTIRDTVQRIRFVSDENKSTFWHQRSHAPYVAKIWVIYNGYGGELGYLTRRRKPFPNGFKIWPR